MGKLFVPVSSRSPADHLRETLELAERSISQVRGSGAAVVELLPVLDQVEEGLAALASAGMDVRAEQARFETVQQRLRRQQARFLREAGRAFFETRDRLSAPPDSQRWWWFLDEAVARQRRRAWRNGSLVVLGLALLGAAVWLVYDRVIAPPPEVRQAIRHRFEGEQWAEAGDWSAALTAFETAAVLMPDAPQVWVWIGVARARLDRPAEAEAAFERALELYGAPSSFFRERGMIGLRVGDVDAAYADSERAIAEDPASGWAYYLRASVVMAKGDRDGALADLEQAVELARAAGDAQLEATARTQWAMILQLPPAESGGQE
jgi:tetratricopeptide (TPR) repeat protein